MQIENNKEEVPFSYYEGLFQKLDPQDAVARTGVKWDGKEFYVNLLGRDYAIAHPVYAIWAVDGSAVDRAAGNGKCGTAGFCGISSDAECEAADIKRKSVPQFPFGKLRYALVITISRQSGKHGWR